MLVINLLVRHPWLRWVIAAAALLALVLGWRWYRSDDGLNYRSSTLDRGTIALTISATGNLKALSTVDVGTQVSGQIQTVTVDFNETVQKGQIIATIDPANFRARLTQAEADLTSAHANLVAAHANLGEATATLKNLEAEFSRKQQVFERQLISRSEYDAALAARDQARARLASAKAGIQVAQSQVAQRTAAVENAQLDVDYSTIRSPVDGVILSRTIEPGQTVAASFQTPVLFSIAEDLRQMQLDLSIDEADVGQIREGLPVRFTVDAFPGRDYEGVVRQVRLAATNTANVITYPVVVAVDNPDGSLLPGMTANAEVQVSFREDVLRVANAALRFRPSGVAATSERAGAAPGVQGSSAVATQRPAGAEAGRAGGNAMAQWDELAQRLQLSEAQHEQMRTALSTALQGTRGQAGNAQVSEEQRRKRVAQATSNALQPLRAQLSPAQQQSLDAELALQANARHVSVWQLHNGKPEQVSIRVGLSDSSFSEVLGGLRAGAEVLVAEQRAAP